MPNMSSAEWAKLVYQIETQGSEKAKAAIAGVNAKIDEGTKSTQQFTQATEKSTQAATFKVRAIDMLVGRFVLYTQAVLYAKMMIQAYDTAHQTMIDAAVKGEEELDVKFRTLTKSIEEAKTATEGLNEVRGELLKEQNTKAMDAQAAAAAATARALKDQADAYQRILSLKDQFGDAWYELLHSPTMTAAGPFAQTEVSAIANQIQAQWGSHKPTPDELAASISMFFNDPANAKYSGYQRYSGYIGHEIMQHWGAGGPGDASGGLGVPGNTTGSGNAGFVADMLNAPLTGSIGALRVKDNTDVMADPWISPDQQGKYRALDAMSTAQNVLANLKAGAANPTQRQNFIIEYENKIGGAIEDYLANGGLLQDLSPYQQSVWMRYNSEAKKGKTPKAPGTWDIGVNWGLVGAGNPNAMRRDAQRGRLLEGGLAAFTGGMDGYHYGGGLQLGDTQGGFDFGMGPMGTGHNFGYAPGVSFRTGRMMGSAFRYMRAMRGMSPWDAPSIGADFQMTTLGGGVQDELSSAWNASSGYVWDYNGERSKARQRRYRSNAYAIGGGVMSGGLTGGLEAAGGILGGPLGALAGGILGRTFGGLFGGGKHKDVGLTPSNPVWTRNEVLEAQNRDLLNILVPTLGSQAAARVQSLFDMAAGQGGVINRSAGLVRAG